MSTQTTLDLIYNTYANKYGQAQADKWLTQQKLNGPAKVPSEPIPNKTNIASDNSHPLRQPLSPFKDNPRAIYQASPSQPPQQYPSLTIAYQDSQLETITRFRTKHLEGILSPTVLETFRMLHSAALSIASDRGYSSSVTQVTFFCPMEIVAYARGRDRSNLWRHTVPLKELGLIEHRPHRTTHRGGPMTDGVLWAIQIYPNRAKSKAAKVSYLDLKAQYRNLTADIASGRTVFNQLKNKMQQSNTNKEYISKIKIIKSWALTPLNHQNPVNIDCCKNSSLALESILDLSKTARKDRNKMVDKVAQAIAYTLSDATSHRFYAKLLWNLLRRYDKGDNYFQIIYYMINRAKIDYQEGFARSAGALFVSRLKKWETWDWLQQTPMVRVGTKPIQA
ncbi:MAG TPA: hypothetical protein ENK21_06475 [Trueperaceae bacterium]|nr:hypothetical protein [Trueperaceae bacterium]